MKLQSNYASARFSNKLFIAIIFLAGLFALLQATHVSADLKTKGTQPVSKNYFKDLSQEPLIQEPDALAAMPNVWSSNGPSSDSIFTISVDPNNSSILYAASSNNLY